MIKKEDKEDIIWQVSGECQNTSCKYIDEIKTRRRLLMNDYIECPKCGYHSFKICRSIQNKKI